MKNMLKIWLMPAIIKKVRYNTYYLHMRGVLAEIEDKFEVRMPFVEYIKENYGEPD